MKSMFLAVTGMAAAVAAQSASDLPACGQLCASNMIAADKSQELGCDTGDIACLCTQPDFIYGLRDCSAAVCSGDDAAQVVSYGLAICRQVGVAITTGDSSTNTADDDNVATVSTVFSTYSTDGSIVTEAVSTAVLGGAADDDVSTYTSVLTNSDGETYTTTGEATLATETGTETATETATETETETGTETGAVLTTYTTDGTQVVATVVTETEDEEALTTFTTDGTQVIRTIVTETVGTDSETETAALTTYTTDGTQVVATIVTETEDEEALTTFTTDGTQVVRTIVTDTASDASESVETTVTDTSTETASATDGSETTATGTDGAATTTEADNAAVAQMTAAPAGILAAAGIAMLLL